MVSKSKKAVALILAALTTTAVLAGCTGSSEPPAVSIPSTTSTTSGSGESSSGEAGALINLEGDKEAESYKSTVEYIKNGIAEEAAGDNNGKISLYIWCSSDDESFESTLAKSFEETFADPRYELKVTVDSGIGEDKAADKVKEGPEDAADVFSFADDGLTRLVEAGCIAKVAQYFRENVKTENTDEAIAVSTLDDTLYAFPRTSDNGYFMYYDKRVFPDAKDVECFDDMIAKANAQGKSVYMNLGVGWYNAAFFLTAGCDLSYKDGVQIAAYGTDKGLSAARAMCHLAESQGKGFEGKDGGSGDNAAVGDGFRSGKLAAAVIGTWVGPAIAEAIGEKNLGAAKLPTTLMDGEQKQLHSFGGYKLVGVNRYSTCPFSSQALAYWLTKGESQLERNKTRGLIPTNKTALASSDLTNKVALDAIEAQKPYAHNQGECVSGTYWASNVGGLGGEIVKEKGNFTDDQLMEKLKLIEGQMAG